MNNNASSVPLLSVIVPVYNPGQWLEPCLNSIFSQPLQPDDYEVIIIDDGCTDGSRDVVNAFIARYPQLHIRFIEQQHAGIASARNLGITSATGQWITFIDADDIIIDGALAAVATVARETTHPAIVYSYKRINETDFNLAMCSDAAALQFTTETRQVNHRFVSTASYAIWFRRDAIEDISLKFVDLTNGEDTIFTATFFSSHDTYCFIDSNLYIYIKHPGTVTDGTDTSKCRRINDNFIRGMFVMNDLCEAGKVLPQYRDHYCALELFMMMSPMAYARYSCDEFRAVKQQLTQARALQPFYGTMAERGRLFLYKHPAVFSSCAPILRYLLPRQI